jgi:hypothetical protein
MRKLLIVGAMILVVACHGSGAGTAVSTPASAAQAIEPCPTSLEGVDVSDWQVVTATGFTFCTPRDWIRRGNAIRRGSSVIRWGTGQHPRTEMATTVARVPAGTAPTGGAGVPDSEVHRFSEVIGGLTAEVWLNRFGRHYYTGADWSTPGVWLVGEASELPTANLELLMYRTANFRAP